MKKYFIISFFLGIFSSYAQQKVGIGIDAPTRTLDINGELRVRGLKKYTKEDIKRERLRNLTADKKGNIEAYGVGLDYIGLGVAKASKKNDADEVLSKDIKYIDLGEMKVTVRIPANKHIVLVVSYSLPMGAWFHADYSTYFGVQFYRKDDTTDKPIAYMTRKFTLSQTERSFDMISITNQYVEEFTPGPEKTVTFYLKGFVDNLSDYDIYDKKISFNMYKDAPEGGNYSDYKNFNWGHAYMTYEILELKANKKK